MSDFKAAQSVKTVRDNEFKIKLVDGNSGTAATKLLTVEQDGTALSGGTNDFGVPVLFKTDEATPNLVIPRTDSFGNVQVVVVTDAEAVKFLSAQEEVDLAKDASVDFDTAAITNGQTAKKIRAFCSTNSNAKYDLGEFDGVSTFTSKMVGFVSPATPYVDLDSRSFEVVGDGSKTIRVQATNLDNDTDAYVTIEYIEVPT